MNKINSWFIGTLPYTFFISYIFIQISSLSYYFVLGAISSFLFLLNLAKNPSFKVKNYTFFLLLFGVFLVLSNIFIASNEFIFYNEIIKNQYFYCFFIINIIENSTFSKLQIKRWFIVFKITIFISLIVILIQQFYDKDFFVNHVGLLQSEQENAAESEVRLSSIYTWTSNISDLIFYFIPISFFVINYEMNRKKVKTALVYILILIAVCILSKARTSLMAAAPVFLILRSSLKYRYPNSFISVSSTILIVPIVIYLAISLNPFLNSIWKDRILESSKGDIENRSMYSRFIAIQAFVKFFPNNPVLGVGNTKYSSGAKGQWNNELANFLGGRSAQIHVGILDLFYLFGLVGGGLFSLFYYKLAKRMYFKSRIYHFPAVFWGFMTLFLANIGLVSFSVMSAGLFLSIVLLRNIERIPSE